MEKIINLHIEKLPEGYYLATTDDLQGLVVQGKTITETLEIARDVAQIGALCLRVSIALVTDNFKD